MRRAPYNPRKEWNDDQASDFRRSLDEFGDLSGIVRNATTGNTIGGHKRVDVFLEDEKATIHTKWQKEDARGTIAYGYVKLGDGTRFSYREVRWTEAKEKAANIAANKWGAEWDWEGVSKILQEIKAVDYDVLLTGFQQHELDALLAADWTPKMAETLTGTDGAVHLSLTKQQHEVFLRAKEKAAAQTGEEISDGKAVELICAHYLT